jgi:hypothetical protein
MPERSAAASLSFSIDSSFMFIPLQGNEEAAIKDKIFRIFRRAPRPAFLLTFPLLWDFLHGLTPKEICNEKRHHLRPDVHNPLRRRLQAYAEKHQLRHLRKARHCAENRSPQAPAGKHGHTDHRQGGI